MDAGSTTNSEGRRICSIPATNIIAFSFFLIAIEPHLTMPNAGARIFNIPEQEINTDDIETTGL